MVGVAEDGAEDRERGGVVEDRAEGDGGGLDGGKIWGRGVSLGGLGGLGGVEVIGLGDWGCHVIVDSGWGVVVLVIAVLVKMRAGSHVQ